MASVARLIALLVFVGLPRIAVASPGIGSKVYTVYTGSSPSCGAIPCIWSDAVTGRLKFRTAGGTDFLLGEADRITSSASDPMTPVGGQCVYNSTLKRVRCYQDSAWASLGDVTSIGGVPAEAFFFRRCTLTSAAAATPVTCLSDADVPSSKSAYLLGWHAKVNGATAWATTTSCTVQDSGPFSTALVTLAVTALTGNAFLSDHSANITKEDAYALSTGATSDVGIEVVCNANGTGSDLVFTLYGVIK